MTPATYDNLRRLIFEKAGIVFGDDKVYLLETRLNPVARKHGLADIDALAAALRGANKPLLGDFVDALTTNETFFFRDTKPFDEFRQFVLPEIMARRGAERHLRIWSAACSTGQEAYSLAMLLRETGIHQQGWRIDIVGTDISRAVLARAQEGAFTQFEVQRGLPIQLLIKYFRQVGDRWEIAPEVKAMVQFREGNLMGDLSALGTFNVVFCRNVLIYFDLAQKTAILGRIAKIMKPDGFLFLGGAETVIGVSDKFGIVPNRRGIYHPVPAPPPGATPNAMVSAPARV